ncbi:MAG: hypothetical protein HYV07_15385 [Deltaproteobacteria bacterium]|nr:hypothetical protein [Deltaproteobacteria bacterium]
MSTWLEAYESLPEESKVNVQRWIHLNKFIARTLKIDEKAWFEEWVGWAMQNPLDYSFMEACIPGFVGMDQEESFVRGLDAGQTATPRVPLRAKNNLGRLSPELQDAIAGMLEKGEPERTSLTPADVAQLQKIFSSQKELAKLKRPDFRKLTLVRDFATDDLVLSVGDGPEVLRLNLMEFSAVMGRALV